ncbi:alpha/beta hydrolase [Frankia casuarinae]|nr:alpha/beta hydrolase [Frankia casuarinae]
MAPIVSPASTAVPAATPVPSTRRLPAASPASGGAPGEYVRAVVAVLLGRGEQAGPFHLLADRLALDGYLVTVVPDGGRRVPAVAENRVPGVPFVLLGSDTGALAALAMAASPAVRPDGVIMVGLPLLQVPVAGVAIEEPLPRALPDLPILLIHGAQDEVSPLPLIRMTTRTASRAELVVVPGGHDVLTGPGRRSVAARTLLFLESLREA